MTPRDGLSIRRHAPAALTPTLRDEIAGFVTRFIDYPRDRLERALDAADYVWLCRDRDGRLVGTTAIRLFDTTLERRAATVIYTAAVAVDPAWRRVGLIGRMGARSFLRERLRRPLREVLWLSLAASPAGYLQVVRSHARCWPRVGEAVPPAVGALLLELAARLGASRVERVDGCIRLPDDFGVSDPSQAPARWDRADPDVDFFLRVNPDYQRGSDLMCLAPVNALAVARTLLRAALRGARARAPLNPQETPG